ncbi:hypothetical protein MJN51_30635, partial [Salmonella enterica subsp. enterica serovar Kentucky]|nr:hypothetical protein [Salmonella enterica subsp. enterica serovar Kentucky]
HILAVPLFIFTNAIIALLLVRTFLLLVQGTLLIRTERAALLNTDVAAPSRLSAISLA